MLKFVHTLIQTHTCAYMDVCQSDQNPKCDWFFLLSGSFRCVNWSQLNVASRDAIRGSASLRVARGLVSWHRHREKKACACSGACPCTGACVNGRDCKVARATRGQWKEVNGLILPELNLASLIVDTLWLVKTRKDFGEDKEAANTDRWALFFLPRKNWVRIVRPAAASKPGWLFTTSRSI